MPRCFILALLALIPARPSFGQDNLESVPIPDPRLEQETLRLLDGFEINLFAADPLIEKPIQMTWDEEGRLWVVGSNVYPHLLPGVAPNDKVYVLEDTDGDGAADRSTIFADGLLTPSGIAVGDGGVYVANSTELLHLRDLDGDGYAEDRRVVLRGFGADDTHHIIHSFRWAPDGMMYINQSIYIFSHIETPWGIRRLRQGGIWHFRPETLELDVFSTGFVNPWGHEFDAWGQSFATDGAFHDGINHVFPGAAFVAAYQVERILAGLNPGQPKHAGLAIVSGRHMPDSLQGQMITNDFRANRVNRFAVEDTPEGRYRSTQRADLVWTDHIAFRPVDVSIGPDGALYLADWYNPIIQHGEVDFRDARRDHIHGRIWRITAKDRPLVRPPELKGAPVEALLDALTLPEEWTRTQARRLLRERGPAEVLPALRAWVAAIDRTGADGPRLLLEGLWLHQALGAIDIALLAEALASPDPRVRAAVVRVLYHEADRIADVDARLATAVVDEHARVRREAVTALGRRASAEAARTALHVLDRPMDTDLDYALWHTLRALHPHWRTAAEQDTAFFRDAHQETFALMAVHTPAAMHRLAARVASREIPAEDVRKTVELLGRYGDAGDLNVVLDAALASDSVESLGRLDFLAALEASESVPSQRPERILDLLADDLPAEIRASAARLVGAWQIAAGRDGLREMASDEAATPDLRRAAIAGWAKLEDEVSRTALAAMAGIGHPPALRVEVAAALVEHDAPSAAAVLGDLPETTDVAPLFRAFYRSDTSRRALEAVLQERKIPAAFATAGLAAYHGNRQRDRALLEAFEASGGVPPVVRMPQDPSPQDLQRIEMDVKAAGDPAAGERIYRRAALACQQCHAIGGAGGAVGPDLSSVGASAPTDYLIASLLKPDEAVKDGYALVRITRTDGETVSGLLVRDTGDAVLLRDAVGAVVRVPVGQIRQREVLPGSLMPAGLTAPLEREEFLDLVAFLSELGEPGPYRLATEPTVRRWEAMYATTPTGEPTDWRLVYSLVSGSLPLDELPVSEAAGALPTSRARFGIEAEEAGTAVLLVTPGEGVRLWSDGVEIAVAGGRAELPLGAGRHLVETVVERTGPISELRIRLDIADTTGRMRFALE
jgi:putative heme-binding domain-containing protein